VCTTFPASLRCIFSSKKKSPQNQHHLLTPEIVGYQNPQNYLSDDRLLLVTCRVLWGAKYGFLIIQSHELLLCNLCSPAVCVSSFYTFQISRTPHPQPTLSLLNPWKYMTVWDCGDSKYISLLSGRLNFLNFLGRGGGGIYSLLLRKKTQANTLTLWHRSFTFKF
jgi:hypothetical protein